jgi:hypothetical protein
LQDIEKFGEAIDNKDEKEKKKYMIEESDWVYIKAEPKVKSWFSSGGQYKVMSHIGPEGRKFIIL